MSSKFRLWKTEYFVSTGKWYDTELSLRDKNSYLAQIDGSGRNAVENYAQNWENSSVKGTSRAAVWAFCEALRAGSDPRSGGAPQIVGIWRRGPAQNFGFVWQGRRYLAGLEVAESPLCQNIPWFNELFERCDGETAARCQDAQIHLKPLMSCDE